MAAPQDEQGRNAAAAKCPRDECSCKVFLRGAATFLPDHTVSAGRQGGEKNKKDEEQKER